MELDFLDFENPNEDYGTIKATVHKTGRLGFSSGAMKYMGLTEESKYKVGFNKNDSSDESLYIVPTLKTDSEGFKLFKAGDYFYLKLKSVFDKYDTGYRNKSVIYNIEKKTINNVEYFKLNKRVKKQREEKNQSNM